MHGRIYVEMYVHGPEAHPCSGQADINGGLGPDREVSSSGWSDPARLTYSPIHPFLCLCVLTGRPNPRFECGLTIE